MCTVRSLGQKGKKTNYVRISLGTSNVHYYMASSGNVQDECNVALKCNVPTWEGTVKWHYLVSMGLTTVSYTSRVCVFNALNPLLSMLVSSRDWILAFFFLSVFMDFGHLLPNVKPSWSHTYLPAHTYMYMYKNLLTSLIFCNPTWSEMTTVRLL